MRLKQLSICPMHTESVPPHCHFLSWFQRCTELRLISWHSPLRLYIWVRGSGLSLEFLLPAPIGRTPGIMSEWGHVRSQQDILSPHNLLLRSSCVNLRRKSRASCEDILWSSCLQMSLQNLPAQLIKALWSSLLSNFYWLPFRVNGLWVISHWSN